MEDKITSKQKEATSDTKAAISKISVDVSIEDSKVLDEYAIRVKKLTADLSYVSRQYRKVAEWNKSNIGNIIADLTAGRDDTKYTRSLAKARSLEAERISLAHTIEQLNEALISAGRIKRKTITPRIAEIDKRVAGSTDERLYLLDEAGKVIFDDITEGLSTFFIKKHSDTFNNTLIHTMYRRKPYISQTYVEGAIRNDVSQIRQVGELNSFGVPKTITRLTLPTNIDIKQMGIDMSKIRAELTKSGMPDAHVASMVTEVWAKQTDGVEYTRFVYGLTMEEIEEVIKDEALFTSKKKDMVARYRADITTHF